MSQSSPSLNLPYIQAAQAQKHVTHNEALERLDLLTQLVVEAFNVTVPPASATEGQSWTVGTGATGVWAGREGQIASWRGGGWLFVTPQTGWRAYGKLSNTQRTYRNGAWTTLPTPAPDLNNLASVGINAAADTTNRLTVSASATLLNHAGGGHQLKINKATAAQTGSLLYQTGFSGRAEMGLSGNDDFSIKVSANGSGFATALQINAATGAVRFPSGLAGSGSTAGALGLQAMAFTCERNSAFVIGNVMSFGNGATGCAGAVMPFAGRVVAAGLSLSNAAAGVNSVDLAINKVANPAYRVSRTATGAASETAHASFAASPLVFAAGSAVSLIISASSAATNTAVGTFFVIFD